MEPQSSGLASRPLLGDPDPRPRTSTQSGLMMLGSGSPAQRPASGSMLLFSSPSKPKSSTQEVAKNPAPEIVPAAPEPSPVVAEEDKKHKKKHKKKKVNEGPILPIHEPGKTPIFVDDVEIKPAEPVTAEPSPLDSEDGSMKPLQMLPGGAVPKADPAASSSASSLLAQGEIPEPKPKILPLYEAEQALEFAEDAESQLRRLLKKFVRNEVLYQKNLQFVISTIIAPIKQRKILSDGELGLVFFNTEVIAEQQSRFLSSISGLNSNTAESTQLLISSLSQFKEFFIAHAQFISNYGSARALASRLLSENPALSDFSLELASSSDVNPWFGILAALNVPVRYVIHVWLLLRRISALLPKTETEKFDLAFAPIKDSIDQIKLHPSLEQSTWTLAEMILICERLDAIWLLKPYRSFVSKKKMSLFSSKESLDVFCYTLSDACVFISESGKFLGKVSLRDARLTKSPPDADTTAGYWLRQDISAEKSLLLGFDSESEALDWADMHDRLQVELRAPFLQYTKVDGKLSTSPYCSLSIVSPSELVVSGAVPSSVSVLDLSTKTSSIRPIAKLNAISDHSAVLDGSSLLVFGGLIERVVSPTLWQISLDTLSCTPVKEAPEARAGHSACVIGQSMYVFGGFNQKKKKTTYINDLIKFDLNSRTWAKLNSVDGFVPPPRAHHACAIYGAKMFIWGGECDGRALSDLVSFDSETEMWKTESPSGVGPTPRHSCCTASVGNYMILYGGKSGDNVYEDVFMLDLISLVWIKLHFPTPMCRRFGSFVHLVGARLVQSDVGVVADLSSAAVILPNDDSSLARIPLSSRWWITPQNADSRLTQLQEARARSEAKNKRLSPFVQEKSAGPSFHHYRSSASKTATFNSVQQAVSERVEREPVTTKSLSQLDMALRHTGPRAATFIAKKVVKAPEFSEIPTAEMKIRTTQGMVSASYEFKSSTLVVHVEGFASQSFDLFNHCCVFEPTSRDVSLMPACSPIATARLRFPSDSVRDQFVHDFSQRRSIFLVDLFSHGGLLSIPCVHVGDKYDAETVVLDGASFILARNADNIQRIQWSDVVEVVKSGPRILIVIWKSKSDVVTVTISCKNASFLLSALNDSAPPPDKAKLEKIRKYDKLKAKQAKQAEKSGYSSPPRSPKHEHVSSTSPRDISTSEAETSDAQLIARPKSPTPKSKGKSSADSPNL